jgi:hypothetical protein
MNKLTVCTTIIFMCSTTIHVVDMKLTEDGKIDDGDIGDVGGVFGKR